MLNDDGAAEERDRSRFGVELGVSALIDRFDSRRHWFGRWCFCLLKLVS